MNRLLAALLISLCVSAFAGASEGEATYQTCSACHGAAGQGNEALASPQLAGQQQAYLIEQLINFRSGYRGNAKDDTHGQVMMASAQALTDDNIEAVSAYLSALPSQSYTSTSTSGDAQQGSVFYKENCRDCHGGAAQGIVSIYAPNLIVLQDWYIRNQIAAYRGGWRGNAQSSTRAKHMRSMAGVFTEQQELENVIAWLNTIRAQ
ncbi:MAG: c-type cytochrome [Halioglobus sp.]